MKNQPMTFIEPLESRIAPATLVNANTVSWTDVDGDLATLHLSKDILTSSNVSSIFQFNTGSVNGSNSTQQQLVVLDLTSLGSLARHVNITVTATTRAGGDGEVDIGLIRAAIPDASTFQFNDGIDLGTVKIQGDLGAIYAGDNYADRALQKLQVDSFGALNSTLQAQLSNTSSTLYTDLNNGSLQSLILASVGSVNVTGNFDGTYGAGLRVLGGIFSTIDSVHIGGSLIGGSADDSGQIFFMHRVGNVTIDGDIVGGAGADSGAIEGYSASLTNAGKITVGGSIKGGSGSNSGSVYLNEGHVNGISVGGDVLGGTATSSGEIYAISLGAVSIGGSVTGNSSVSVSNSGYVFGKASSLSIGGDIRAGLGFESGMISLNGSTGNVSIDGSLIGGSNTYTGTLLISGNVKTLTIDGYLQGGSGYGSGYVSISGALGTASIGKNSTNGDSILGGSGSNSGQLYVGGDLKSLTLDGSLAGGSVSNSGLILVGGTLGTSIIRGDVVGGSNTDATSSLDETGYLQAGTIKSLTINGDVTAGSLVADSSISSTLTLTNSGAIRASVEIVKLNIDGSITGTADCAVAISATGHTTGTVSKVDTAIGQLTVGGDVTYANILAGYAPASSSVYGTAKDADASIGTVTINGDMQGTNIVAGAALGGGSHFGASGNTLISGTDRLGVTATIASIIVKGQLNSTSDTSDGYGIVSQLLKGIEINGTALVIAPGAGAVTQPVKIGGSDTSYLEVN